MPSSDEEYFKNPHLARTQIQIDPLCKYSWVKHPNIAFFPTILDQHYTFYTRTQMRIILLNHRFRKYLEHEFPDGGKDLVLKSNMSYEENSKGPAKLAKEARCKIVDDYLKAHKFHNCPSDLCVKCTLSFEYVDAGNSWFDPIDDDNSTEILKKNYYIRDEIEMKTYRERR